MDLDKNGFEDLDRIQTIFSKLDLDTLFLILLNLNVTSEQISGIIGFGKCPRCHQCWNDRVVT